MKSTCTRVLSLIATVTIALGSYLPDSMAAEGPNVLQTGQFNQEQAVAQLKSEIAGKENLPAEQVFKNIQMFKGMPAGRVLAVMQIGYSKSLGVDCTHCHVPGQWEKEDKPTKQITREMSDMVKAITSKYLKEIKNLKNPNPVVNCTTCHRGQVKPALNMP